VKQTAGKRRVIEMCVRIELKGVKTVLANDFTIHHRDELSRGKRPLCINPFPPAVSSVFYYIVHVLEYPPIPFTS
jgi:hypothetical protein